MKAIVYEKFGGPDVYHLADMPVPEPRSGEVQVRVEAAGLNPADWKIREGLFPPAAPKQFPAIPLRDFAGRVTKLGAGVTQFQVGEKVYGVTGRGAAAEFTVAHVNAMAHRPENLEPDRAATVPLAGMTAWQALFQHAHLQPGERVLKRGGRLVSITAPPDVAAASALGVTAVHMVMQPSAADLAEIARLIESDEVRPVIEETVPLEKMPEAMAELQEGHTVGKIAVRVTML